MNQEEQNIKELTTEIFVRIKGIYNSEINLRNEVAKINRLIEQHKTTLAITGIKQTEHDEMLFFRRATWLMLTDNSLWDDIERYRSMRKIDNILFSDNED